MSGLLLPRKVEGAGTHTHTHTRIPALLNHFISLLSCEWRITQNLSEVTGTGTAKRLETTQRHEQKGKRKLFFNKTRSDLDWREKRELDQGGACRVGGALFPHLGGSLCYSFSYVFYVYPHVYVYTCIYTNIHIYLYTTHYIYTHIYTYIFSMNISHNKAKKIGASSYLFNVHPKPTLWQTLYQACFYLYCCI